MVVESQAVGRRKQAKEAPCPLIPRDSLKTPELYCVQCWVLKHSIVAICLTPDVWRKRGGLGQQCAVITIVIRK